MITKSHESTSTEPSPNSNAWDNLRDAVPFAGEDPQSTESTPNTTPKTLPDLPTKSPNHTCDFYLRETARQDLMKDVKSFLESTLERQPYGFTSKSDLDQFCSAYADQLASTLSPEDRAALKNYSGLGYKTINQVARGQWNYDLLGAQTPEKLSSAEQAIDRISHAISSAPAIGADLITHRGTNLDSFQTYGISSLADLTNLKNQFFLETGFTSTSLAPDKSFTDREFDDPLRRTCDIAVEYLVPAENRETIGLLSGDTSYNPEQRELLIDKSSLSYIQDVEVSPDQASAKLKMVLIPRQIYDPATR